MNRKTHDHTVDLSGVCDRASLHARLRDTLDLPAWYGRNLDALYDALTDTPVPAKIFFTSWDELQDAEPEYFDRFCRVLRAVESVLPGSSFVFAPPTEDFYAAEENSSAEDECTSENIFAAEDSPAEDSPAEDFFVPEETSPFGLYSEED